MYLLSNQFRVPPLKVWLKQQQQFALIVITLCITTAYTVTIIQQIFITEIFKAQLVSAHVTWFHTTLTEFFLNSHCLLCLACYNPAKQFIECTWRRMSLPSWNLYKCKQVAYSVVVGCLFIYPLFFFFCSEVVATFLFIRWSCKQAHYSYLWSFCLSF